MPKFGVRLFIKKDGSEIPSEYDGKIHYKDYQVLVDKKDKLKPPNTFRFKNRTFLYVKELVKSFDKNGRPILKYVIDNAIPNDEIVYSPMDEDELEQSNTEKMKITSDLLDSTFARGEMKSVIAGSQKTKDELSMKSLILGALIGGFGGFMICIILVLQHVIHI